MIPGVEVQYIKKEGERTTNIRSTKVAVIDPIPLEEVDTSHFDKLDLEPSPSQVTLLLIHNMVDNIPEEFNEVGIGEGAIGKSEEKSILQEMIKAKLEDSIFNLEQRLVWESVLVSGLSAWGIKQSNARMSSFTPIDVDLIKDHPILRSDGYHQTKEEEDFLEKKFQALMDAGIVKRAKNPIWGHPVFVAGKKMTLPKGYSEMTHEQKEAWKSENILNRTTIAINQELDVLCHTGRAEWVQFLTNEPKAQRHFTLECLHNVGRPNGVENTPALFFDRVINEIIDLEEPRYFAVEGNGVVAWLDDLLVYATTFADLCTIIKNLLEIAKIKKVRFNLRKCDFGAKHTIWCGREIKQGLWNFSPTFFEKVLSMPKPKYRHEAAQLVYLANWLSPNIPQLAALRAPFPDYANLKGKKLIQVQKEMELIPWTEELEKAYLNLKEAIVDASKRFLATYDETKPILLFTDSSNKLWSLAVFQNERSTITNDVRTLQPKPMMFLSGSFTNTEIR
eukprot:snap_masked-scaffold_81-processed-gene-0.32-mRNA-1 protein AED:1.00 eAED:1.00 QI:0/0/0/0/1/1/3/0/505